jgi:hypothetical protein
MQQLTHTGPDALEWREAPGPRLSSGRAALVRAAGSLRPQRVRSGVVAWADAQDALLQRNWTKLVNTR